MSHSLHNNLVYINNTLYNLDIILDTHLDTYLDIQSITLDDIIKRAKIYTQSNQTNQTNQTNHINLNLYKNYFIKYNGKLALKTTNYIFDKNISYSVSNYISSNIQTIEIIERQNGGDIIDMFKSIISIGTLFITIGDFIIWLFKFIGWFVMFVMWLFMDFLNPYKLSTDFFQSMMVIVISICRIPYDLFIALLTLGINTLGGWMQGFWGWDQSSLTKNDKNSNYFKSINRSKGSKCYLSNTNTVPFSVILGTILCPPLGVFMDLGMAGWLNIIICILLTLLFYLPGLCYALLIIYA